MRCALVGNPNSGKTTLFNTLTGATARVGNWSGVTVESSEASFATHTLIDLPGLYSLDESQRLDEQTAREALNQTSIDCYINVIDATQLERQLYLTSELLEQKRPVIILLTKLDAASGIQIDTKQLSEALHCPVLSSIDALEEVLASKLKQPKPLLLSPVEDEDEELALLDARYRAVHELVLAVEARTTRKQETITNRLDKVLLHRFFALPLFMLVMYTLFFIVVGVGGACQDSIMQLAELALPRMAYFKGLGMGIATVISFIPVMGLMFFMLACLEASGYMARVAFVMDRLMRFLGLPGKAFVPLMVGFGCNVPAVMATRTLESKQDRLLTILMSPFMSCSARLTIYTVFVTAFFPSGGQNVVFSLYIVGILMAILTGLLLRRTLLKAPPSPLLLELPLYQRPNMKTIAKQTYFKLKAFLWRAGRFIVPICLLLGLASSIKISGSSSILEVVAKGIQPLFSPMGISEDNWPAVVGLFSGIFAKEVVVGTLNSLYVDMGSLSQFFDGAVGAYAYLLFILLYIPCASTMAVVRMEANRKVMWFSILWSTSLAYGVSVLFYQLATRPGLASVLVALGLLVALMLQSGFRGGKYALRTS